MSELARLRVGDQQIAVPAGLPLHQALLQNGVYVETPCGARGTCRKCRVKLAGDVPPPGPADRENLTEAELDLGFRLACQHRAAGSLAVSIMPADLADPKKAAMGRLSGEVPVAPWADLSLAPEGSRACGLALDVGTTTLVAALLDLRTGEELAAASMPNPQAMYGADLMSRLTYAIAARGNVRELQVLVLRAAGDLAARLARRARVAPAAVVAAVVTGNTCMHHLFLGLDVETLAAAPYVPAETAPRETPAADLGLPLHPRAPVYTLPNVAGFVGGDALCAGLAANLDHPGATVAVVDIGTNGECLLHRAGTVYACSAPAGPAFEGGELYMGMRANPGAVETVTWQPGDPDIAVGIIRGAAPRGICGSGLLDAAAALLYAGALDGWGRLRRDGPLASRVQAGPWGEGFILAEGEDRPVVLTQKDIRQLQLAKGAIRSGVDVLLRTAGIGPDDLDALLLAGAFGNYLRRESALAIGLLPPLPVERVQPVGNAAAQGAKLTLLSRPHRERVEALARAVQFVDLATHPDFEEIFMEALNFPTQGATAR